ncbi:Hypothetical predicted protein [Olea europaea subsp. europaea]|uniref:Uncharacterized protein n=1 Tax=Olea europaea subsp. europaea TaxID=158383 RepID=A0A8S0P6I6_OLEEU|nr:Hypothetical predicted protein [Olea europaea subsp. europaea]
MAGNALHLLVTLLAFSCLISLNAVPTSRTILLLQERKDIPIPGNTFQITTEQNVEETIEIDGELINRRMDIERGDYPGSGANNRHTPHPPLDD